MSKHHKTRDDEDRGSKRFHTERERRKETKYNRNYSLEDWFSAEDDIDISTDYEYKEN